MEDGPIGLMHRLDRRRFMVGAGAMCGFAGASSLATLIAGCSPPDADVLEDRVRTALRELLPHPRGARLIAAAAGIPPAAAFEMFRRDVSSRSLYALSSNGLLLSEFIEARCGADLESGRTRRIHGWWIAETELAVAVLTVG